VEVDGGAGAASVGAEGLGEDLADPVQLGRRWPIERTHARANQYGKLRWCTERRRPLVAFWLALAGTAIVLGRLVRPAWVSYRWEGRPPRRP
jgi:hypothetical protein